MHTVKRHVAVTRIVPAEGFPFDSAESVTDDNERMPQAARTGVPQRAGNQTEEKKRVGSQAPSIVLERAGNELDSGISRAASTDIGRVKEEAPQTLSAGGRSDSDLKSSEQVLRAWERYFKFSFSIQVG
jgi:hypothetical protein